MIQIKELSKVFSSGKNKIEAIHDINLTIEDSDIFGIIGLSGAGKSTLVRCINFLEKPTSGTVIFDGVDLGALKHRELLKIRQQMSMIFQGFNLLQQRTALGNVCYPMEIAGIPKEKAKAKAVQLLEMVGLADRMYSYPSQLSGGQKQRVAIARALSTDPKVLLCDEATSALDPNTTNSILELLKKINCELGVTIIVITHEMKVIERICNKVAVIDQSRIVEQGFVKDVFLSPKSSIARELIFPAGEKLECEIGNRIIRLVFNGESAFEPIISNLAIECRAAVNILRADTKNIAGKAFGQMILQLPENKEVAERVLQYLAQRDVSIEEVQEV